MAVAQMKYLNIYGPESRLPGALAAIARSEQFMPEQGEAIHSALKIGKNDYEPLLLKAKGLLKDLGRSSLAADYIADEDAYKLDYVADYVERFAAEVAKRSARKIEIENNLAVQEKTLRLLAHMTDIDINIDELFTVGYLKVRVGRLPKESYTRLSYYIDKGFNFVDYFNFIVYDFDGEYYWGLYFAPEDKSAEIDDILNSLYFERIWVPEFVHGKPSEAIQAIRDEQEKLRVELSGLVTPTGIASREELSAIENMTAWLAHMNQLHGMYKYALVFNSTFYISGFVAEDDYEAFADMIESVDAVHIKEASKDQEVPAEPPVRLKSSRFSRPFQMFTEMYGLPGYGEIDPTLMVTIVYSLAYGLMFADVGQGLVLGLVGYFFMYKKKNLAVGLILTRCSIFCCFFGFLFGSVFGYEHLLDPVFHAMGLHEKPFEVMEPTNITTILIVSLGFGVVVVATAIVINIVQQIRKGRWGDAIAPKNGIAGLVFYASIIALALDVVLFKHGFSGSQLFFIPFIVLPLIMMFFAEPLAELLNGDGLKLEHPGEIFVNGFFELFDALLEFLSNTVSFLRVGGFILAHAGMMVVVMTLAEMAGHLSWLVVIGGNIFVICLEGLIVGIQALRLNYYEVFSRFYAPNGQPFTPLVFVSDTVEL